MQALLNNSPAENREGNSLNLGKYKMKKNPGLLRPSIDTFNHFIGAVIS